MEKMLREIVQTQVLSYYIKQKYLMQNFPKEKQQ
jgi:hypothetical protein